MPIELLFTIAATFESRMSLAYHLAKIGYSLVIWASEVTNIEQISKVAVVKARLSTYCASFGPDWPTFALNIGSHWTVFSGLALLGISTIICDFMLMYLKERADIQKKKFVETIRLFKA